MKTELKKLVFPNSDSEPVVVCEDPAKFSMVMSVFQNYERLVGSQSGKVSLLCSFHSQKLCMSIFSLYVLR